MRAVRTVGGVGRVKLRAGGPDACLASAPPCARDPGRAAGRRGAGESVTAIGDGTPASPDDGVFTDGSATPNPGPGGWAAVHVVAGEVVAEASGSHPDTTNNRMELTALLEAVRLVPEGLGTVLYSDSQLAVRTVNEWAPAWEARGWRRSRGPVENLDLVRPLVEALRVRPELRVAWVRAHVGHRWNEYADRLAGRASRGGV